MNEPLGKYLSMAHRAHSIRINEMLRKSHPELGHGQFFLLLALYKNDGISQHALAEMYHLDKAVVARGSKKLEGLGFIERKTSEKDKRVVTLHLTKKAKQNKPAFFSMLKTIDLEMRQNISEDDLELFLTVLKKICKNLCKENTCP